ncbi:MAG: dienelactone hydrolase family protein [Frankiaceae bacterium]
MTAMAAVQVPAGTSTLSGDLDVPAGATGLVAFAHGSGSSRHSPRNREVATRLRQRGLATLLVDLLTPDEESADRRTGELRFDIGLLAERVVAVLEWARSDDRTGALPGGAFGASTGGGAALVAAAMRPDLICAVVSRGGRPDLAGPSLPAVRAPTLLIVGSADHVVRELNEHALDRLSATKELAVVPGAGHLFEEPGALRQVADLAGAWFARWLAV